jgi:hypothetical protein
MTCQIKSLNILSASNRNKSKTSLAAITMHSSENFLESNREVILKQRYKQTSYLLSIIVLTSQCFQRQSIDIWQPTHSWASRFDIFVEKLLSQSDSKLQRIDLMRLIAKNITINMGSFELLKHIPIGKE